MESTIVKCNKPGCENVVDESVDETNCGYGKCVDCCGGCLHRRYFNLASPAGRAKCEEYEAKGLEYLAR